MTKNTPQLAFLYLMIAAVIWGGMFPVSKSAINEIDPSYLMLIRYAGGSVLYFFTLWALEGRQAFNIKGSVWSIFWIGSLGIAGFNLLAFNGLKFTTPQHAAVIMSFQPMMAVLISWFFFKQKPHPFTLISVVVAFVGVFLVITGGDLAVIAQGGTEIKGDFLVLLAALCWVIYTMQSKRFPNWTPLRFTTMTCFAGAVTIALVSFIMNGLGLIAMPTLPAVVDARWVILYIVVLAAFAAVLTWNMGIKTLGPVNGMLFINIVPITAFAIGLFQGEIFKTAEIVGAVMVIGAVVANSLYLLSKQKK